MDELKIELKYDQQTEEWYTTVNGLEVEDSAFEEKELAEQKFNEIVADLKPHYEG